MENCYEAFESADLVATMKGLVAGFGENTLSAATMKADERSIEPEHRVLRAENTKWGANRLEDRSSESPQLIIQRK